MDDLTPFEGRFEERLRAFARTGVRSVDSASVARAAAAGHPRRASSGPVVHRLGRTFQGTRLSAVLAAAVAIVVVSGTFYALDRNRFGVGGPDPTLSPSPSIGQSAVPTLSPSPSPSPSPTPTPSPTPSPFVVPNGRNWTVTVRNESPDPTTLFVTEQTSTGMGQQCGTVTPSVVPPETTMQVTFRLPAKSVTDCWIWVNPVPGEGGSLFQTSDAPMPGEIFVMADGQAGWSGP